MKFLKVILLSIPLILINYSIAQELPFYKENDHFAFFCEPVDQKAVDTMLEKFEPFFKQISTDFKHNPTEKFTFKIYPNITKFHKAIGKPDAPDYICGYMSLDKSEAYSVSPSNPGSHHDYDSIITGLLVDIVGLMLKDKYKNTKLEPSWLYLGICLYKSCYFSDGNDKFLAKDTQKLPTLQQLKESYEKFPEFTKIQGWQCCYSIAKFIDKKYGFDKLLALLENNNSTQSVLGVTEDEFRTEWIEYLIKNYGQQELPFYKENDHFIFYCEPVDQKAVDTMLEKFESFFKQISTDFKHNPTSKFTFKIYPNITDFHNAIGKPDAPDYICCYMSLDKLEAFAVSPNNTGSHHNYDSIMVGLLVDIVGLMLKDKYKNTKLEPSWLYLGICLYKSCYYNDVTDKLLAADTQKLPTLQQLKEAYEKFPEFTKIEGWRCCHSIAKFIDKTYGFDKLLAILENNNSTQSVFCVTEDEFRAQWIEYLTKNYGN